MVFHLIKQFAALVVHLIDIGARERQCHEEEVPTSTHHFDLLHKAADLAGTHQGDFASRPLNGKVDGAAVDFSSSLNESHGDSLQYRFTGTASSANEMSGALDMGEYRKATWTAKRAATGGRRG